MIRQGLTRRGARPSSALGRCQPSRIRRAQSQRLPVRAAVSDVMVLDFDGVLVDSEKEVTASALLAAEQYWPFLFDGITPEREKTIVQQMRKVRPVLVRGYESMVMARTLMEDPNSADQILADWANVLPAQLKKYGEDSEKLHVVFEAVRNNLMKNHEDKWLQQQPPFPGVVDALQASPFPVYFATSKAAHRVSALMKAVMGLDVPENSPRLFASLLPPEEAKAETLRVIMERPLCQDSSTTLHFVDDRLDTLTAVLRHPDLAARWKLYLASWGYCTASEIEAARRTPGVKVLELQDFVELLKFGLVMQVDDGCEPTAEEVQQGVA